MTNAAAMPHAILSFRAITSLRLQKILARRLIALGWRVTFLFLYEGKDNVLARARAEIDGLAPIFSLDEFSDNGGAKLAIRKIHPSPLRALAAKAFCELSRNREIAIYRSQHERMVARSLAALTQLSPSVLFVTEDGVSSNFRLLAAARHLDIPIIVVPFNFHAQIEFDIGLERRRRGGDLRPATGIDRQALRVIAPQWLKTGRFNDAVMFPPAYILSLEALGITVPNPWTRMGGFADALCVESEMMRQHYILEGTSPSKMIVTGSPYVDDVADGLVLDERASAAFRQPRWIEPERARLLVAWFKDWHRDRHEFSEFPTYHEMTLAFFRHLRTLEDVTITVSLHPNCNAETRSLIENEGFFVSDEYIMRLIGRNDLLFGAYSSTSRWALACGKPVINYDAYRLEYGHFDAPGFINTSTLEDVKFHLERLTKSPEAFRDVAARQCAVAESWGVIDGQCSTRIVEVAARLVERAPLRGAAT